MEQIPMPPEVKRDYTLVKICLLMVFCVGIISGFLLCLFAVALTDML